jgi:WD40 repeat protein
MRFFIVLFAIAIVSQVDRNSQSALAQSTTRATLKQDDAIATAGQPSKGSIYFDAFSDVNGAMVRFENGSMSTEFAEKKREIFPYSNNSTDPILLEVLEDSESLGADGMPGVLALSWQSTPSSLEYSGFVYLGRASRIYLPRLAAAKTSASLENFQLRFRYKGRNKNSDQVNFKVACRIEPGEAEAYGSRIEMRINEAFKCRIDLDSLYVTDQWQEYSAKLGSGEGVTAFLNAQARNPTGRFKVVWEHVGAISDYRPGDTLLVDELEIVDSRDRLQWETLAVASTAIAAIPNRAEQVQEGNVKLIWFPRFSPDGKWLLSAHGRWEDREPGEVRMWDVATGKAKHVIGHSRGVRSVDWSPKGTYFVSGAYGGNLGLFISEDALPIAEIELGVTVEGVRISADEKRVIATLGNGDIGIFAIPKLREIYRFRRIQPGGIWGMALSTDGELLATSGPDKRVRIVHLDTHQVLHVLEHPGETNGVAFSIDGKHLLTGCYDAMIRVFDVETGEQTGTLRGHERGGVTDLQFSQDGKTLVSSGMDTTVRVWDVADLNKPLLKSTLRGHKGIVFGVAISPLGDCLVSAGWDDKLILWDLTDGTERWSWKR